MAVILSKIVETVSVGECLTLAEARKQCRVFEGGAETLTPEEELLQAYISATTAELENNYDLCFGVKKIETIFSVESSFVKRIYLPIRPLISVESVSVAGVALIDYKSFAGAHTGFVDFGGYLPKDSLISIQYKAGFGMEIAENVKQAARLLVAHYFDNQNPETSLNVNKIGYSVEALLKPYLTTKIA